MPGAQTGPACAAIVLAAMLAGVVGGCASAGGAADGRWMGTLSPEPGSVSAPPGCRGGSRGVLTVRGNRALFTPDDGTAVLAGEAEADGRIRAVLSRLGADRKPYVLRFEGRLAAGGGEIAGTYAAPGCRAAVTLRPA